MLRRARKASMAQAGLDASPWIGKVDGGRWMGIREERMLTKVEGNFWDEQLPCVVISKQESRGKNISPPRGARTRAMLAGRAQSFLGVLRQLPEVPDNSSRHRSPRRTSTTTTFIAQSLRLPPSQVTASATHHFPRHSSHHLGRQVLLC